MFINIISDTLLQRARFPSLSRIINLPMERIFWQFTFLFHIPLRVVELGVGCKTITIQGIYHNFFPSDYRYNRLKSVDLKYPRFYEFSRQCYLIFGIFELVFLTALSVVGEREYICRALYIHLTDIPIFIRLAYHVVFFYVFGLFALGFFITNAVCHASSIYYLNPYVRFLNCNIFSNIFLQGQISFWCKVIVTICYVISMPILFGAFVLYWKRCITASKCRRVS